MFRITRATDKTVRPVPISGVVNRLFDSLGLSRDYGGWLVVSKWAEIVGEHYARKSQAIRFVDGTLFIAVPDASWRQMMEMDKQEILKVIHKYPYGRAVKELRTVWGRKGI